MCNLSLKKLPFSEMSATEEADYLTSQELSQLTMAMANFSLDPADCGNMTTEYTRVRLLLRLLTIVNYIKTSLCQRNDLFTNVWVLVCI